MATVNGEPKGLGGWLILPAIGLFVMPIRVGTFLNTFYASVFEEGLWDALTTPGSESYHLLWAPAIISEMVANIFFIFFDVVLIFLFFMKSHRLPAFFVAFLAANALFVVGDFIVTSFIPAVASANRAESIGEVARAIGGAVIWIPYFLMSKRVKNTFVKTESAGLLQPITENRL
jgi:hypothetical protein